MTASPTGAPSSTPREIPAWQQAAQGTCSRACSRGSLRNTAPIRLAARAALRRLSARARRRYCLRGIRRSAADGFRPDSRYPSRLSSFLCRVRPCLTRNCPRTPREETIERGREIGSELKAPVLILLSGDLGAGKTTLTKGIVSGLGAAEEDEVTSPTFTLVHKYERATRVYHVDLYRIGDFHDLETLGLEDVFSEQAVVIVEWPDRLTLRTDWPVRANSASNTLRKTRDGLPIDQTLRCPDPSPSP